MQAPRFDGALEYWMPTPCSLYCLLNYYYYYYAVAVVVDPSCIIMVMDYISFSYILHAVAVK